VQLLRVRVRTTTSSIRCAPESAKHGHPRIKQDPQNHLDVSIKKSMILPNKVCDDTGVGRPVKTGGRSNLPRGSAKEA
jgi:hypothetical protein